MVEVSRATRPIDPPPRGRARRRWATAAAATFAAGLALALGLRGGPSADRLAAEAAAANRRGEPAQVAAALDGLRSLRPLTGEERFLAAQSCRVLGRFDEALAALGGFPATSTLARSVPRATGLIEFDARRLRRAEAAFRKALDLDPADDAARRGLIRLLGLQLRKAEVAGQFEAIADVSVSGLSFDDLDWWASGVDPSLSPRDAAAALAEAHRGDPGDVRTRVALAETLRKLGRLDEADAVLPRQPWAESDTQARVVRARIDAERDEPTGALHPATSDDDPPLAEIRGRAALGRGDLAGAERAFRVALAADPADRDAQFGMGQALRLAGKAADARPFLDAAESRDGLDRAIANARTAEKRADPAALRAIAAACERLGRRAEARSWYRLALARNPTDPEIQAAIYRLGRPPFLRLNKPKS